VEATQTRTSIFERSTSWWIVAILVFGGWLALASVFTTLPVALLIALHLTPATIPNEDQLEKLFKASNIA